MFETERLILREMNQEDFPALCSIIQDEQTMYAYNGAMNDAEAQEWLDRQLGRYRDDGFGLWAVCLKDNGKMIGQCGLSWQDADGKRVLEVGYLFNRAYWHQGYAIEAAHFCKCYAFGELNANEVYSIVRDNNFSSINVAIRNGMDVCGSFVKHYRGVDMPHLVFRAKRVDWLTSLAEQGNPTAQFTLAKYYSSGEQADCEKVVFWLSQAAEQGDVGAMCNLAKMRADGVGTYQSKENAMYLLGKAICYGNPSARFELLLEILSVEDICTFAEDGNRMAQLLLSICYMEGIGVEKDEQADLKWLERAAEQGEPFALLAYGDRMANGDGVPQDRLKALSYFWQAAQEEYQRAYEYFDDLRAKLNTEIPYYLVKVTDKKWADSLLDGNVFFRTLDSFSDLMNRNSWANNSAIGDSLEGTSFSSGSENETGVIDMRFLREKVFCLYALEYDEDNGSFVKPDSRLREFGDTAIVIKNGEGFIQRIKNALDEKYGEILWWAYKRVTYDVDFRKSSVYSEFHKTRSYAWQNEFRIALDLSGGKISKKILDNTTDYAMLQYLNSGGKTELAENDEDFLSLALGSIQDIAVSMPISELLNLSNAVFEHDKPRKLVDFEMPRKPLPTFFRPLGKYPIW